MSGGAFDYAQYRIDDIIDRIEREIERATCERTPLVTKQGVSVCDITQERAKRYCPEFRFVEYESANNYFKNNRRYKFVQSVEVEDGDKHTIWEDQITGNIFEVTSYTHQEYEPDEDGNIPYYPDYTQETLQEFRRGIDLLKRASVYAQRIDWLISGDDGEDNFHKRLEEDLKELEEV